MVSRNTWCTCDCWSRIVTWERLCTYKKDSPCQHDLSRHCSGAASYRVIAPSPFVTLGFTSTSMNAGAIGGLSSVLQQSVAHSCCDHHVATMALQQVGRGAAQQLCRLSVRTGSSSARQFWQCFCHAGPAWQGATALRVSDGACGYIAPRSASPRCLSSPLCLHLHAMLRKTR